MEELIPITLFVGLFWSICYVSATLSDNRVRRELGNRDLPPESLETLFTRRRPEDMRSNLKWGMIAVAVSLALVAIHVTGLTGDDAMTWALVLFAAGASLVTYYVLFRDLTTD